MYFILLFFLASFLFLLVLKKLFPNNVRISYFILGLVGTKKLLGVIDRLAKHKIFLFLGKLGISFGFGYFGHKRVFSKKRYYVFLFFHTLVFYLFYELFLFNSLIFKPILDLLNPYFIRLFVFLFCFFFGAFGFVLSTFLLFSFQIILYLLLGLKPCPTIAPLIPGIKMPRLNFSIPLYVWLDIFLIAILHEFSHGVLMRRFSLKLKEIGVLLVGLLPLGAYVEPDENEFKKLSEDKKALIYSLGPYSNFLQALAFLLLLFVFSFVFSPTIDYLQRKITDKVMLYKVVPYYDACGVKIKTNAFSVLGEKYNDKNWEVKEINGKKIYSLKDAMDALKEVEVAEIVLYKDGNTERVKIRKNKYGLFGVVFVMKEKEGLNKEKTLLFLLSLISGFLFWGFFVAISISVFNFLPVGGGGLELDGKNIAVFVFSPFFPKSWSKEKKRVMITRFFNYLVLALLIINIIPWFV